MSDVDLVVALRMAVARADPTWINQPSHLRRRLDEVLGPDARAHRTRVHQLVIAAEERVPVRLKRNGWSPAERDDLAGMLVATRGWTKDAAVWAVTTWAVALELTDDRPSVPDRAQPVVGPGAPSVGPPRTVIPTSAGSVGAPVETRLPEPSVPAATLLPIDERPPPTSLPSVRAPASGDVPATVFQAPPAPLGHVPAGDAAAPHTAPLPTRGARKCTKIAAAFLGHEIDVAYAAKTGASPAWVFCVFPLLLAPLLTPGSGSLLTLAGFLAIAIATSRWRTRLIAVRGDDVWLIGGSRGRRLKAASLVAHTTRDQIVYRAGWPFPSIQLSNERLWFQHPFRKAARRLPRPTRSTGAV